MADVTTIDWNAVYDAYGWLHGLSTTEALQNMLARAESLIVSNSQLEAKIDQLNTQARYLMQDQKKVGPNLKDVRLKLRKEWIPEWLKDPQAFRPGTKMPTFWRLNAEMAHDPRADDDRKAIAAYLWQESYDGRMPGQDRAKGNVANGKQLFETVGCMACHSLGEGDQPCRLREPDEGPVDAEVGRGQLRVATYLVVVQPAMRTFFISPITLFTRPLVPRYCMRKASTLCASVAAKVSISFL